jgi:putative hsdS
MEYKKYKLGDICKIFGRIGFRGYTTEDLVSSPSNGAISLSPSNIVDGVMDLSKCTYISWEKYEESPEIKVAPNDIVIVKTGNSYGRTAIIRNVEHPMTLNPQFVVLKDIQINPVYLAYFLKTDEFQKQIYGIVGGSAIPTLSQEDLANLIVRVPNENTQNTIADILDSLDGKIEINKRINDNLEAMAKQLYNYWFVQFDFPNEEGKPYKSSGGAMVWNEKLKREIPKGWSGVSLKDLAVTSRNAITPVENEVYQHFSIPSFDACGSYSLDNGSDIKSDKFVLQEGQLLVSKLNPWFNRVVWVPRGTNIIGSTEFVVLNPNNKSESGYIYSVIKSPKFVAYCSQAATGTSHSQRRVSPDVLMAFKVAYEPDVAQKYGCFMENIQKRQAELLSETATLTKQRNEFLPLLMNGQISIQ